MENKKATSSPQTSCSNNYCKPATVQTCPSSEYHELVDYSRTGKIRPWVPKKTNSLKIADSYERLGYIKKAERMRSCGDYLKFRRYQDNSLKLQQAYFCRIRLCPMCNWRRSLKIFNQVSQIMDVMQSKNEYQFLFLTLTIRNVGECELEQAIKDILDGYLKLIRNSKVKRSIKGAFRALEVTYNKNTDEFHPHLHIVLAVPKDYFDNFYIDQEQWTNIWKKCMNLDYTPMVNIKKFKDKNLSKSVAEAAKYATKDSDIIHDEDSLLQDKIVFVFDGALRGKRLISYSGDFKKIYQMLKLDDVEKGDLVHVEQDDIRNDMAYVIETYNWRAGAYIRLE